MTDHREYATRAGVSHERARFDVAMAIVRGKHQLSPSIASEANRVSSALNKKNRETEKAK